MRGYVFSYQIPNGLSRRGAFWGGAVGLAGLRSIVGAADGTRMCLAARGLRDRTIVPGLEALDTSALIPGRRCTTMTVLAVVTHRAGTPARPRKRPVFR